MTKNLKKIKGKGLGTQLMSTIIQAFPKGVKFGLEVDKSNPGGIYCYKKCGFQVVREVPNYYGHNKPALKMVFVKEF